MTEQQQNWKTIVNSAYQAIVNRRRSDLSMLRAVYSIIEDCVGQGQDTKQAVTLEGDTLRLEWDQNTVCRLRVIRGEYVITPTGGDGDKQVSGQVDALRSMGQLMAEAMDADLQEAKAVAA
jgi:hypothetical protein